MRLYGYNQINDLVAQQKLQHFIMVFLKTEINNIYIVINNLYFIIYIITHFGRTDIYIKSFKDSWSHEGYNLITSNWNISHSHSNRSHNEGFVLFKSEWTNSLMYLYIYYYYNYVPADAKIDTIKN